MEINIQNCVGALYYVIFQRNVWSDAINFVDVVLKLSQVFEEFQRRKEEIDAMKKKVQKAERQLQTKREEMETIKARWLKPLHKLISRYITFLT